MHLPLGQGVQSNVLAGDIFEMTTILVEEVVMVGDIGIEVRTPRLHDDLAQKARVGKLMQRVVDSRQGNRDPRRHRLAVQLLGGQMPIAPAEEQAGERQALAGGP